MFDERWTRLLSPGSRVRVAADASMFSSFFETSTFGHPAQNDQRPSEPLKSGVGNGGVLAVWSAREDRRFEQRLRAGSFDVTVERVRGRLKKGGPRHVIFLAAAPSHSA